MYVYPKSGLKIRDADLKDHLPAEGREVPDNGFWNRRLRDGDVTLEKPATDVAATDTNEG